MLPCRARIRPQVTAIVKCSLAFRGTAAVISRCAAIRSGAITRTLSVSDILQRALNRLGTALEQLEASVARRAQADSARANLEDELAVMQDDRARLAMELDAAMARNQKLTNANDDVAARLDHASATVRALLDKVGSGSATPIGPE